MQRKKKVSVKKSADIVSPRASTRQRKVSENRHPQAKEATDLIASSVRKQKLASPRILLKNKDCLPITDLNATLDSVKDDTTTTCCAREMTSDCNSDAVNIKGFDDNIAHEAVGTMFSPAYHISRTLGGEIANEDFHHEDRLCQDGSTTYIMQSDGLTENVMEERNFNEDTNIEWPGAGSDMSSDISAVYFSVKNSKLECVDEYDQDHLSADGCINEEEFEELEFDPYFFMKNLPDLSSVVPPFRPALLPKQTRSCPLTTLVLDLDETLVHSTLEPCDDADFTFTVDFNKQDHTVYVRARPHLREFMNRVHDLFEVIIFTASQGIYAEQLLNVLDPKRKVFRHRVFRESCVFVNGNYLKDLTVLGRDLAHVIIIDNSPQAFGFQIDNGIPIESWFDDEFDRELLNLLPFLESLVTVEDVRPLIADRFDLRKKIEAADSPFKRPNHKESF